MDTKIKVGITLGDMNGISPEIILKVCANEQLMNICTPVVYGSSKVFGYYRKVFGMESFSFNIIKNASEANERKANLVNCWDDEARIEIGTVSAEAGKFAQISLERAVTDAQAGHIDVLVTAPIQKESMKAAGFEHPGHTEYLQSRYEGHKSLMFMVGQDMKIAVQTGHIPLVDVGKKISKESVLEKIKQLAATLKTDFSLIKPKIAVLGLNPHSGDNGTIGSEDIHITNAVAEAKNAGILAFGPYPADGFFGKHTYTKFDAVLAMYHDQGLIPFKMICPDGVNFTAGLPLVRTSPAHGTGFDIAGQNIADVQMLSNAIYRAIDIYRTRTENKELQAITLPFSKLQRERGMS